MIKLLFYPADIKIGSKIFAYCQDLGIKHTSRLAAKGVTAVFFNHPNSECIYPKDKVIRELSQWHRVFNLNCNNTRKSFIADIHMKVFGYNANLTKKYKGRIVKKSELQYKRNEAIVPKASHAENLYHMKFIDTLHNGYYSAFRVPYFDGTIPFVVQIKRKDPFDRKSKTQIAIKSKTFWFHPDEIRNIYKFCKAVGLDYGELDIMRSKDDHRIYIIDVNDKPGFGQLAQNKEIHERFTQAFKTMIDETYISKK